MALQRFDQAPSRSRLPANRSKEGVAVRPRKDHSLMLIKKAARALIRKIASGKASDGHCLLNDLLG
jgi:hypothetical protein